MPLPCSSRHLFPACALLLLLHTGAARADAYAPTAWPALHADGRNSDSVSFVPPAPGRVVWTALDGSAVLTAVTIGPGGRLYATTGGGQPRGNLHAFDRSGKRLWTAGMVDDGALLSAPLVDRRGAVYVGDLGQMRSFYPDGSLRWTQRLPAPVVSSAFTRDGDIVAVTVNGHVLVMRRRDGRFARPWLKLEGTPPGGVIAPRGLWQGMVSPGLIVPAAAIFQGRGYLVTSTPAVHPGTGRVFVATTDGHVYGIDIGARRLEIAFDAPVGEASGTSVALSPNGSRLYAGDGAGNLYAIDTASGAVVWRLPVGSGLASPAVAQDGTVYMGSDGAVVAVSEAGTVLWRRRFDDLAASALPVFHSRRGAIAPQGRINSVITVTPDRLYLVVIGAYPLTSREGRTLYLPRTSALLVLRRSDGALDTTPVVLRDSSEAVVSIDRDGTVYVAHGSVSTSFVHFGLNRFLPAMLEAPSPVGGISALRP